MDIDKALKGHFGFRVAFSRGMSQWSLPCTGFMNMCYMSCLLCNFHVARCDMRVKESIKVVFTVMEQACASYFGIWGPNSILHCTWYLIISSPKSTGQSWFILQVFCNMFKFFWSYRYAAIRHTHIIPYPNQRLPCLGFAQLDKAFDPRKKARIGGGSACSACSAWAMGCKLIQREKA